MVIPKEDVEKVEEENVHVEREGVEDAKEN
jgi:hypothetical protein